MQLPWRLTGILASLSLLVWLSSQDLGRFCAEISSWKWRDLGAAGVAPGAGESHLDARQQLYVRVGFADEVVGAHM